MILADTCVLLNVVQARLERSDWSVGQLQPAIAAARLVINAIVYAEFPVWYDNPHHVDATRRRLHARFARMPYNALFLAGKAHLESRKQRGTRTGVLPDFLIGAHAAVLGWPILARDVSRFRGYFPTVTLIAPQS